MGHADMRFTARKCVSMWDASKVFAELSGFEFKKKEKFKGVAYRKAPSGQLIDTLILTCLRTSVPACLRACVPAYKNIWPCAKSVQL